MLWWCWNSDESVHLHFPICTRVYERTLAKFCHHHSHYNPGLPEVQHHIFGTERDEEESYILIFYLYTKTRINHQPILSTLTLTLDVQVAFDYQWIFLLFPFTHCKRVHALWTGSTRRNKGIPYIAMNVPQQLQDQLRIHDTIQYERRVQDTTIDLGHEEQWQDGGPCIAILSNELQ